MKVAFHTLGCKTNAYETQAVKEQFLAAGYEIGEFSDLCDVYVINTCAVTKEAARKSRQMTGRCKRQNPAAFVVVTGCYAQEAGAELLTETMADLVVGNGEKSRIVSLVQQEHEKNRVYIKELAHCREYEKQSITAGQEGHVRAYVKIQDGCDRFCSYCLIPYLRGRSRSRSRSDILKEVTGLAKAGYKEIVLTGIDISSYHDEDGDLADLIGQMGTLDGLERIRLGSLEESIISEDFIQRLSSAPAFCPQFHLSLQSGSDAVLQRMNRRYTTEGYSRAVRIIRETFPDAGITTDIITGFPGETEEEFAETMKFAEQIGFSRIHVFPYSRRNGTRADRLPEQLPKTVKEERAGRLIAVAERLRETYESRLLRKQCTILAEEWITLDGRSFLAGYTPEYVRILVPAGPEGEERKTCTAAVREQINQMIRVVPERFQNHILIAESCDF